MRILFIAHYFQPEPNFFFGLPFAKELARRGHSVQVLTGFPNYPGGRIYEGYRIRLLQTEMMEGIPVYRFPIYPSHDRSSMKRTLCYCSLSASMAVMAPWLVRKADVAYVAQGPATLGLPATVLRWLRGIPFVYNIQDLWPDTLVSTGMFSKGRGYTLVDHWCRQVYRQAARIVVIAPGMKRLLQERGVPEHKIEVIYNWCDEALIGGGQADPGLKQRLGMEGKFNVVFAGNMGKAQAMDAVIEAAGLVGEVNSEIQFVFIGSGVEVDRLKQRACELNLHNVLFHRRKPVSEIGAILRAADVLLVHLRKDPLFAATIPSKTQAYLALGRPILMAVEGDASDLVRAARAGECCTPQDPRAIADAALRLFHLPAQERKQIGENGAAFYQRELAFPVAVQRYERAFEVAAGR
ncbi:MAG: glycosyltransferase family 4 protein [Phycisphaerae bacterium]|nr:glycosyltransferase family 4 protein [Phycisphaerae bacterium]